MLPQTAIEHTAKSQRREKQKKITANQRISGLRAGRKDRAPRRQRTSECWVWAMVT